MERLHRQGAEGPLLCHLRWLEDVTRFCEPCPVSRWHAQAREHLALPGPSLAEHLKTVCGNPSRPPGLSASMLRILWILQGENTETERLASPGLAALAHSQVPAPNANHSFSCGGGAGNPFPTDGMLRNREAAITCSRMQWNNAQVGRRLWGRNCREETEVCGGSKHVQS